MDGLKEREISEVYYPFQKYDGTIDQTLFEARIYHAEHTLKARTHWANFQLADCKSRPIPVERFQRVQNIKHV